MIATYILHTFCEDKTSVYRYISEYYPNDATGILFCAYSLAASNDRNYIKMKDIYTSVNILQMKNN